MKEKCIIVGAGTYGQVYAEYLKDKYEILGFVDDNSDLHGKSIHGYKVLGDFTYLLKQIEKSIAVFVPIGNNKVRLNLLKRLDTAGFSIPNFIHESATLHETVQLGKGVYILPNSSIMPYTVIEDYTMISMGVSIAHHTLIKEGTFMSQKTNIGASITLGRCSYIGIGAIIMTGVDEVGENALVGAGAVIIEDVPDGATVVGNPGKVIKRKTEVLRGK